MSLAERINTGLRIGKGRNGDNFKGDFSELMLSSFKLPECEHIKDKLTRDVVGCTTSDVSLSPDASNLLGVPYVFGETRRIVLTSIVVPGGKYRKAWLIARHEASTAGFVIRSRTVSENGKEEDVRSVSLTTDIGGKKETRTVEPKSQEYGVFKEFLRVHVQAGGTDKNELICRSCPAKKNGPPGLVV